jgi:hypothetical protein
MEVKIEAKLVDPEAEMKMVVDEQSSIKEAKSEDISQKADEQVNKNSNL